MSKIKFTILDNNNTQNLYLCNTEKIPQI